MQELVELEKRISAALERIGLAGDHLAAELAAEQAKPVPVPVVEAPPEDENSLIQLLRHRLAAARDRETALRAEYETQLADVTHQLDVSGVEMQRLRKSTVLLREEMRVLREAGSEGVDAALINRALLAELEALRAIRLSEVAELDDLAASLDRHVTEAEGGEGKNA